MLYGKHCNPEFLLFPSATQWETKDFWQLWTKRTTAVAMCVAATCSYISAEVYVRQRFRHTFGLRQKLNSGFTLIIQDKTKQLQGKLQWNN